MRVCPTGWSWAVALVQSAHEWLLRDVRHSLECVQDKVPNSPLPEVGAVKLLYIDNFAVIADSAETAAGVVDEMESVFASHDIEVARDLDAEGDGKLLGFQLDRVAGECRPTAKRYWKIADALDHIHAPGTRVTGKEVERLLGHLVSFSCSVASSSRCSTTPTSSAGSPV